MAVNFVHVPFDQIQRGDILQIFDGTWTNLGIVSSPYQAREDLKSGKVMGKQARVIRQTN